VWARPGLPLLLLLAVTVVWGYTFVPVKHAVAVYPLFAFLCVRFAISTAVLAPFAWRPLRRLPLRGWVTGAGVGLVLATAYALQTAGLHLSTASSAGFITGLYVVFTPVIALVLFGTRVPAAAWVGIVASLVGLLLLNGMPGGSVAGNLLVLGNAVAQSFQIASMERFAPRYDARALTFLQMAVCGTGFTVIALALGQLEAPHGRTVWSALVVTGVFAGALGYLVATWVQARTTAARAALVFMLEAPFAALFGVLLAGDQLGWIGWGGCALMLAGIVVSEPAAAEALRRILPGRGPRGDVEPPEEAPQLSAPAR
jgi:drug/metabolite transporter (DMT)-like permease